MSFRFVTGYRRFGEKDTYEHRPTAESLTSYFRGTPVYLSTVMTSNLKTHAKLASIRQNKCSESQEIKRTQNEYHTAITVELYIDSYIIICVIMPRVLHFTLLCLHLTGVNKLRVKR